MSYSNTSFDNVDNEQQVLSQHFTTPNSRSGPILPQVKVSNMRDFEDKFIGQVPNTIFAKGEVIGETIMAISTNNKPVTVNLYQELSISGGTILPTSNVSGFHPSFGAPTYSLTFEAKNTYQKIEFTENLKLMVSAKYYPNGCLQGGNQVKPEEEITSDVIDVPGGSGAFYLIFNGKELQLNRDNNNGLVTGEIKINLKQTIPNGWKLVVHLMRKDQEIGTLFLLSEMTRFLDIRIEQNQFLVATQSIAKTTQGSITSWQGSEPLQITLGQCYVVTNKQGFSTSMEQQVFHINELLKNPTTPL